MPAPGPAALRLYQTSSSSSSGTASVSASSSDNMPAFSQPQQLLHPGWPATSTAKPQFYNPFYASAAVSSSSAALNSYPKVLGLVASIMIPRIWNGANTSPKNLKTMSPSSINRIEFLLRSVHLPSLPILSVLVLVALCYVHRLRQRHQHVQGLDGFETRLFTIAFILAVKYFDDFGGEVPAEQRYKRKEDHAGKDHCEQGGRYRPTQSATTRQRGFWSDITGLDPRFLKNMEMEVNSKLKWNYYIFELILTTQFLNGVDYHLSVSLVELEHWKHHVLSQVRHFFHFSPDASVYNHSSSKTVLMQAVQSYLQIDYDLS